MLSFGWGPGDGQRMLAPGLPDALFTDGAHLGWVCRDGVYVLLEDVVHFVSAPDPSGVSAAPGRVVVVHPVDGAWAVTRFSPRNPVPEEIRLEARAVVAGSDWAVLDKGFEREVARLADGSRVRIPVGAADARPQPFVDGEGLIWLVQDMVYRLDAAGRVQSCGSLPEPPTDWVAGPNGAAAFLIGDAVWGMAPAGMARELDGLGWQDARFSPSGDRLLGRTQSGIESCCLRTGATLWSTSGPLQPIGFAPVPVYLDERTGRAIDAEGQPIAGGFNPSAATLDGEHLFGPGGTAWDLRAGEALWTHAPLCAEHIAVVGDVLAVVGDGLQILSRDGQLQTRLQIPFDEETEGLPVDVFPDGDGGLCVIMEDGAFSLTLDGRRRPISDDPPDGLTAHHLAGSSDSQPVMLTAAAAAQLPIESDGAVRVAGRVWAWTEDGMLCTLSD